MAAITKLGMLSRSATIAPPSEPVWFEILKRWFENLYQPGRICRAVRTSIFPRILT